MEFAEYNIPPKGDASWAAKGEEGVAPPKGEDAAPNGEAGVVEEKVEEPD